MNDEKGEIGDEDLAEAMADLQRHLIENSTDLPADYWKLLEDNWEDLLL